MKTIVPGKALAAVVTACAHCLDKDPMRYHPGRMRVTRTSDALTMATETRTGKVRISFRISCDPGDPWTAVLDADSTSRLAKVLKSATAGKLKKSGNGAGVDIERTDTTLVVSAGGQRVTLHAGDVQDEEPGPPDGEAMVLVGATDLASRIAGAMPFCAPADYRDISKGPHLYLRDLGDGTCAVPAVVATDGHRLFVDGDALDCTEAETVLRVPGDNWRSVATALDTEFERIRLVRTVVASPVDDEGGAQNRADKNLDHLVFESADREVRILLEQPQTGLPHWASFVPRETSPAAFDVTCDKTDLTRAAKAAGSGGRLSSKTCMLRALADRGMLLIRSADTDGNAVEHEVDAEIRGASDRYVHLNPRYVLNALGAIGTEKVRIRQVEHPLDAVRFLEVAPDGTERRPRGIIVMPVRGCDPPDENKAEGIGTDEAEEAAAS